ncbi:MAG TPA: PilZ domain-containing protein [Vicinamibacteria bacterium]|nr:PilZ domain-containing protein [Vicinamibacteria bacterium]
MHSDVLNPRRAPRAPIRCDVSVRSGVARWSATTEELGPRGCQLVTDRLLEPGEELALRIRCQPIGRTVRAVGRVVWVQRLLPVRAGVSFSTLRTDLGWFGPLTVADAGAARAIGQEPERLPLDAVLWLGPPPPGPLELAPADVALLRRIGEGCAVDELRLQLGPLFERLRGPLFGLLARRQLVRSPLEAAAPEAWAGLLSAAEARLAEEGRPVPQPPRPGEPSPLEARALVQEGLAHLAAGRIETAVARLEAARKLAPDDGVMGGLLQLLAPWRS